MKIYQFLPLAVLFIAGFCAAADKVGVPAAPIVFFGTLGALGIALQLEDRKWGEFVAQLVHALHEAPKHRA